MSDQPQPNPERTAEDAGLTAILFDLLAISTKVAQGIGPQADFKLSARPTSKLSAKPTSKPSQPPQANPRSNTTPLPSREGGWGRGSPPKPPSLAGGG